MTIPNYLFVVLLAMCCVVVAVVFIEEKPNSRGVKHATYSTTMHEGGSGQERHAGIRWLACTFAVLQIVFLTACLPLGIKRRGGGGGGGALAKCGFRSWRMCHGFSFSLALRR